MTALRLLVAAVALVCAMWPGEIAWAAEAPEPAPPSGVTITLPVFDYTAAFVSPGGGGLLRAEETGAFRVELRNLEARAFKQIRVSFQALLPLEGLTPSGAAIVPELLPGERRAVEIPVVAERGMPSGTADYVIEVVAEDGAYGPPMRISFRTRAFVPPRFEILAVDRQRAGDRMLVKAQIQNLGGPARDVRARFVSSDPAIALASEELQSIGDLGNGQVHEIATEIAMPPGGEESPELPLWLEVNERHADLGIRERLTISLRENEGLTKIATPSIP